VRVRSKAQRIAEKVGTYFRIVLFVDRMFVANNAESVRDVWNMHILERDLDESCSPGFVKEGRGGDKSTSIHGRQRRQPSLTDDSLYWKRCHVWGAHHHVLNEHLTELRRRNRNGTEKFFAVTAFMSALRLLSSAARRAPSTFALSKRGYAEVSDKIKLSLVLPHQVRLVNIIFQANIEASLYRLSSHQQMLFK
jgi:hypothetical protein